MQELAAYSTMAMTLGLVVARPRLGTRLRLTPAGAAAFGVVFLWALGVVRPAHVAAAVTNLWSPFVAIASVMVMTSVAGRVGLLDAWAARIEAGAGTTTRGLFARVFFLGLVTSSALSNDAAILVLTPVVLSLVRRRYPGRPAMLIPFAFAVFMSAGVAAFPVSNPMNMVVADFLGIGFNDYALHMIPVALVGGVIGYLSLRILFRAQLAEPLATKATPAAPSTPAQRLMMVLLGAVLLSYPLVSMLGGPVWAVAGAGALASLVLARALTGASPTSLLHRGIAWDTLAFLLAALVMSMGLRDVGLVDRLSALYAHAGLGTIGVTSAIGSALLNNHPMSHLNMMALAHTATAHGRGVFAALVGGDLGPRLLPIGSLAGLLWFDALRRHGVEVKVRQFVAVGLLLAVPTLVASLAILGL